MASKTTPPTLSDAQNQLATVDTDLGELEAEIAAIGRDLGAALSRVRVGDSKAKREAADLSMRQSECERRRQELLLERAAVEAQCLELEEVEAAQSRDRAFQDFEELTDRARALETTLTEQIQAAAKTARELREIHTPWTHARREIALMGMGSTVEDVDVPRNPNWLFTLRVINDAAEAVANWLKPAWRYPTGPASINVVPEPAKRKPIFVSDEDALLRHLRESQAQSNQDGAA